MDLSMDIAAVCEEVCQLLLEKNRDYGNSALEPIGIFAQGNATHLIDVRIDDKLKRIQTTRQKGAAIQEDTEFDLIGYLILKRVLHRTSK